MRGVRPPTAFKFLVEHNNLSGNWVLGWAGPRNYKHWDLLWQQTPSATHIVDILTWHTKFKEYGWCCGFHSQKTPCWIILGFSLSFTEEHTTLRPSMSMEHGMAGSLWQGPAPCHAVTRLVTTDGRPSRHIMNKCKNSKTVNIIIRPGPAVQWLITKMLRMPTLVYTSTQ